MALTHPGVTQWLGAPSQGGGASQMCPYLHDTRGTADTCSGRCSGQCRSRQGRVHTRCHSRFRRPVPRGTLPGTAAPPPAGVTMPPGPLGSWAAPTGGPWEGELPVLLLVEPPLLPRPALTPGSREAPPYLGCTWDSIRCPQGTPLPCTGAGPGHSQGLPGGARDTGPVGTEGTAEWGSSRPSFLPV